MAHYQAVIYTLSSNLTFTSERSNKVFTHNVVSLRSVKMELRAQRVGGLKEDS